MPDGDPTVRPVLLMAVGLIAVGLAVGVLTPHWTFASVLVLVGLVLAIQVMRIRIRELRDRIK